MTLSFLYILLGSIFQLGWLYNIKQLRKDRFKGLTFFKVFSAHGFKVITPVILYIFLGIGNILFLTLSMKSLPASVTYAIWTGLVIAASSIIDILIEKKGINLARIICILMIGVGIIGLRLSFEVIEKT